MVHRIVYTKLFNHELRSLRQQGKTKVVQAALAAASEAGMNGEILAVPRTKHGESRIPDVEKYDLSDGCRLVVQLVDGKTKSRAFLFVGTHDDAERWLDRHRGHRWVKNRTDGTLEFVAVTERTEERHVSADRMDLESPEQLLAEPLLRFLSENEWNDLALPDAARRFASTISGTDYEQDAYGILARLVELAGEQESNLVWDLLYHAHAREWSEFQQRLKLARGESTVASAQEVAPAMLSIENSESFITFDDPAELNTFFKSSSLSDWMLFLHPEQKRVALTAR